MRYFADFLKIAGVIIIFVAIFMLYTLWVSLSNEGPSAPLQTPSGSSQTDAVAALVNNASQIIYQESYIIVKIVLLFLLAIIGGKLVTLGFEAEKTEKMGGEGDEEEEDAAPKAKRKSSTNPY